MGEHRDVPYEAAACSIKDCMKLTCICRRERLI